MEYAPYANLEDYIWDEPGQLSENCIRRITSQILDALVSLHRQNITHRDLKPEIILVLQADPVDRIETIVADFGIANACDPDTGLTTSHIGTYGYMAQEILGTAPYSCTADDLWSPGIMMHEMVIGRRPVIESTNDIRTYRAPGMDTEEGKLGFSEWHSDEANLMSIEHASRRRLTIDLLRLNPNDRPTAANCLECPWFHAGVSPPSP